MPVHSSTRAFTLIELLIVIAIILILIAIALPNFLEAQLRARVTSALADMRSMATAMESYYIDFKTYPGDHDPDEGFNSQSLYQLTTPIAYIALVPEDPFTPPNTGLSSPGDEIGWEMASTGNSRFIAHLYPTEFNSNVYAYALTSHGPDVGDDFSCNDDWPFCGRTGNPCDPNSGSGGRGWVYYSATNGTKSSGELVQVGGEHRSGRYCLNGWQIVSGSYPRNVP
jgi:prepilin-type N-terminal cleavage/methylation domain-containing protein